jgi:hypothetical protein
MHRILMAIAALAASVSTASAANEDIVLRGMGVIQKWLVGKGLAE